MTYAEGEPFAGRIKEITSNAAVGGKGLDPVAKILFTNGCEESELWMPLAEFHGLAAGDELNLLKWERKNEAGGGTCGHRILSVNGVKF